MQAIPFLTRLSFEDMVFAVLSPFFWSAAVVALVAAWLARRYKSDIQRSPVPAVLIPFAFPIAIILWASIFYASLEGKPSGWYWQDMGIIGILGLQTLAVVLLLMRPRRQSVFALVTSLAAIWWAGGAAFVAGMAIHNDWL